MNIHIQQCANASRTVCTKEKTMLHVRTLNYKVPRYTCKQKTREKKNRQVRPQEKTT